MIFYELFQHDPNFLEIKRGEVLLREGDIGEAMYVLIEGQAKIERQGLFFAEIGPGDFVGELAVIDGSSRINTTTATTDCKFVVVDRKRFEYLVVEAPGFALEVMRILALRLRRADELLIKAKQHD
ncbi:MAG: Crp/Fnr family transcriptional regulator [Methylococcus sp.]|jgi:CRP-like cAMP-binding protein|nr:MAG: Crp/Fnr family transcriptional regulator [Methylococcus sp.]